MSGYVRMTARPFLDTSGLWETDGGKHHSGGNFEKDLTMKFDTTYTIAKEEMPPFTKFKLLLRLVTKNRWKINPTYGNDIGCAQIIGVIGDTIRETTAEDIAMSTHIAIMIDGDTDVSAVLKWPTPKRKFENFPGGGQVPQVLRDGELTWEKAMNGTTAVDQLSKDELVEDCPLAGSWTKQIPIGNSAPTQAGIPPRCTAPPGNPQAKDAVPSLSNSAPPQEQWRVGVKMSGITLDED
ncbi:hypothetical protein Bbelb_256040 [Branchiostoma belcheri]|nr:hypothetical protein Bbelb_256040 [Branchiostoma belcheri]